MTNVHYNVIQEYGKNNLNAQLADCKRYLIANSDEALAQVEKIEILQLNLLQIRFLN